MSRPLTEGKNSHRREGGREGGPAEEGYLRNEMNSAGVSEGVNDSVRH